MIEFTYFQDPGHGWIEVPLGLVQEFERDFGLEVSSFSYLQRNTPGASYLRDDGQFVKGSVLLEEDSDAPRFIRTFEQHFGVRPTLKEKQIPRQNFVRRLPRYEKESW